MQIISLSNGIDLAWCALDGELGHEAGRRLLRELYREKTQEALPPIRILGRGKPVFESGPWHFSISHTTGHAFCALAPSPIGIDAEELSRVVNPRLAEKILSPGELSQYEGAEDKNKALLTFWVLKEAEAKRTGTGLNGYPNHTNFTLEDPRVITIGGCLLAVLQEEQYAF